MISGPGDSTMHNECIVDHVCIPQLLLPQKLRQAVQAGPAD